MTCSITRVCCPILRGCGAGEPGGRRGGAGQNGCNGIESRGKPFPRAPGELGRALASPVYLRLSVSLSVSLSLSPRACTPSGFVFEVHTYFFFRELIMAEVSGASPIFAPRRPGPGRYLLRSAVARCLQSPLSPPRFCCTGPISQDFDWPRKSTGSENSQKK